MADIGVNIHDMGGELRDVDDILADLGGRWGDLSREQQQNLGLQIAGKQTCQPSQKWLVNNVLNSGEIQRWTIVSQIRLRRGAENVIHHLTIKLKMKGHSELYI